MKKPKSEYAIQTVTNALRLLDVFRDEEEVGVAELARRLGLHKNNVFRLLATLEEQGYIEQCPVSERYRLGIGSLELGHSFLRSRTLCGRARPILEQLCEETGESAHLGLMSGFEVIHVDGVSPNRLVLASLRAGHRLPVHCTALGKVLLGHAAEAQRQCFERTVIAAGGLERRTRQTILDPDKFFEHIRTAAGQGYAVDVDECEIGMTCAAAPVRDASGKVIAAFSVSAPSSRIDEEALLRDICPQVVAAADRLSHALGFAV
ncbi:MAG TPA: IclR family transcriptional regulator [Myxococcota bacterium]